MQTIVGLEKSVAVLIERIDRLSEDRKVDKKDYKDDQKELRSDFKDFQRTDFKALKDEVSKLKLNWAKIVGAAAAIGAGASFFAGLLRAKLGL